MHLRTDTASNSHFARVPTISKPRTSFSIAEKHVTTGQFDNLIPMQHKFVMPGDTINATFKVLARLQTQIATLYDDLYVTAHAWYVRHRLVQTNFARFQFNSQLTGPTQDNSSLTTPKIDLSVLGAGGFPSKSLYDYFGYPTLVDFTAAYAGGEHINNYLARSYNLTWNLNYRDQNLQNAAVVDYDEGPDNPTDYILRKRGKRHDKFTSAATAPQKGPAVAIPLGTTAPIILNSASTTNMFVREAAAGHALTGGDTLSSDAGDAHLRRNSNAAGIWIDPNGNYLADLSAATAATLNQLRQSYAVQHLLEADMRSGTRDVEAIQARWGVTVPDFTIDRPEYLGGATWDFDGHIVPQTSASTEDSPQANLTQFSQMRGDLQIQHSFTEHGSFFILVSARSNITYQQGLQKELSYKTRYDFIQPEFVNLGEVAMKNKEIYAQGTSADQNTFGYNEYGYEARFGENRVSSEMRSNYPQSLDTKHMADDYGTLPTLSSGWIESNTPISRNIAVSAETADPIEFNTLFQGTIVRTLPMFSIPGLTRL